jgi:hypothetical protein
MSQKAVQTYNKLCAILDSFNWKYRRFDDELYVRYSMQSEDLPVEIVFAVSEKYNTLRVLSFMPFKVPEEKRVEMALAICHLNDRYINGFFDFNVKTGEITFRMTNFIGDGELGKGTVDYLLSLANHSVDKWNDRLFALVQGYLTLEQFMAQE